jgi:hypothetical protein
MATNSMVPYSNPQGNNQTNPGAGGAKSTLASSQTLPGATSTLASATGASTANPLVPATATATVPSAAMGDSDYELSKIFGSGVGGDINSFLGSVGGTNSVVLQDYIKSLQPQMATAQAQTNAALGAGGVSANSSVAGIADANLQAQEMASIAGESANLTESGLQMQESMIQGIAAPVENYTAQEQMEPFEILGAGIEAAGNIAGAVCPAKGSLYLVPGDKEVPVETLKVGDEIMGIDGEAQVIEEIQTAQAPILRITTDDNYTVRNSRVHAFALPAGGFVVAIHALGKTLLTTTGTGKVISVEDDGVDTVFNVITNGSHTYRADGIWALGVGEAERYVSMDTWNRIGDGLASTKKEL